MNFIPMRQARRLCAAGAIALLTASAVSADVPRTQPDEALQQLASELQAYRSVAHARSQGYVQGSGCESHPTLGTMGFHYVRPDLLGLTAPVNGRVNGTGTYTGANPPAILLYVPDGQGGLKLAGIEFLVFAAAWDAANSHPPMYRGRLYNYMVDNPNTPHDEAHGFMPHYDLHVWLFDHNPGGLYTQWNPSLSCGAGVFHHVGE